jgi:hypothetical protein
LDANRLSQGQLVAAVSAVALFIISFLPWFGISGGIVVQGVGAVGGSKNLSLWEAENPLDIYLLIVILVALVPVAMGMLGGTDDAFPLAPVATSLLAGVGTLLIIYQLFDQPLDTDLKVGVFLGLLACGGIAVGGYLQMQEDVGRDRY